MNPFRFAPIFDFTPNYSSFKAAVRPNVGHWRAGRPAIPKSCLVLEKETVQLAGNAHFEYLLEYTPEQRTKLFFDVEWRQDTPIDNSIAKARLVEEVINPVNALLFELTQYQQACALLHGHHTHTHIHTHTHTHTHMLTQQCSTGH